jgi:hypothetical protein
MNPLVSTNALAAAASIATLVLSTTLPDARALGQVVRSRDTQIRAEKPVWLEGGTGKDLRIKLSGDIVDETGAPAHDCKLTVTAKTQFTTTNLPVVIRGNLFQVWVPVGDPRWLNVHFNAASADGRRVACETISSFQLREAAVGGVALTIKPPERSVAVTVVGEGRAVHDAFVVADVGGPLFTTKTDGTGVASFSLLNRVKLSQLTAWTDDFKIGGYAFNRNPPRDPAGNEYTIELDTCHPQVIRIINDENKLPVRDLDFVLTVGTGPPNYQFPGPTPGCEMRTNERGEAVYRWFPDWKTHGHSYVEIRDPHWIKAASEETVNGAILVRVKKSRFDNRKRVVGQVASTQNNVAGLSVEMWSFQGEEKQHSDALFAFTDENGRFAANYLPGSTYCICVNDARYVSNIIDLIPYDPVTDKTNAPSLTISEGQPVEVAVTSGPARSPVAYQLIQLGTPHDYSWRENGTARNGHGGRRWWITTDERGKAHTVALPEEKIQGSVYTPAWRSEASADVKTGGITRLEFHRPN